MKGINRLLGLLATCLFVACAGEEDEPEGTSPWEVSQIQLSETIQSDGITITQQETYSYSAGKLTKHVTSQEFAGQRMEYEAVLSYPNEEEVIVTDSYDNTATYHIGTNGYADRCTYQLGSQTREYAFSYSDEYLTQVDESINGEHYTSLLLGYDAGELQSIRNPLTGFSLLCQVGSETNRYQLPCDIFSDSYPLSYHIDAIYAHLLGKQSQHLVSRITPEGNDTERTDYAYQLDANQIPVRITLSSATYTRVIDVSITE